MCEALYCCLIITCYQRTLQVYECYYSESVLLMNALSRVSCPLPSLPSHSTPLVSTHTYTYVAMTLTVGVTKAARASITAAVWKLSVNWNTGGRGVGSHITPTCTPTPSHPTPTQRHQDCGGKCPGESTYAGVYIQLTSLAACLMNRKPKNHTDPSNLLYSMLFWYSLRLIDQFVFCFFVSMGQAT